MEVINKSNCCQFCNYRKELYPTIVPQECKECGFLKYRDQPYTMDIPIKEDQMEYIGTARDVRELIELLKKTDQGAFLELKGTEESWAYIEVWYDPGIDTVILK